MSILSKKNHWSGVRFITGNNLKNIFISKISKIFSSRNLPKFGPTFSYQVEVRQSKMENAGDGVFAVIILLFFQSNKNDKNEINIKRWNVHLLRNKSFQSTSCSWFKCQQITSLPQKQSLDAGCVACFYHGIYLEVVSIKMWSVEYRCDKTPHSRRELSRPQIVRTTRYSQTGNELPGFELSSLTH